VVELKMAFFDGEGEKFDAIARHEGKRVMRGYFDAEFFPEARAGRRRTHDGPHP
jgi:hypothetical protein